MDNHIDQQRLSEARKNVQHALSLSPAFRGLSADEQRDQYLQAVEREYDELSGGDRRASALATGGGIDDFDYDKGFDDSIDAFEDLVDSVDFPQFVADLLEAVFSANLQVMNQQTDAFIKLMKESIKPVGEFVEQVNEPAAFGRVAEKSRGALNLVREKAADGSQKFVLSTPDGNPADLGDNELQARIMEAKIEMAQEHRAILREVILMGVTRLVVEKGKIRAGVMFDIKSDRNVTRDRTRDVVDTRTGGLSGSIGGPAIPFLPGFYPSISGGGQKERTSITVSSASSVANDELRAKLSGEVEIDFKTDYFKLDNFMNMYAPPGEEEGETESAPAASR